MATTGTGKYLFALIKSHSHRATVTFRLAAFNDPFSFLKGHVQLAWECGGLILLTVGELSFDIAYRLQPNKPQLWSYYFATIMQNKTC